MSQCNESLHFPELYSSQHYSQTEPTTTEALIVLRLKTKSAIIKHCVYIIILYVDNKKYEYHGNKWIFSTSGAGCIVRPMRLINIAI